LVTPMAPVWMIYVSAGIIGAGIGGCIVLVYIIFPDIAEIGEAVTGNRSAGSISGAVSFMRKASGALASYFVALALQFSGYIKPIKTEIDGIIQNVEQIQPGSLILSLRIMIVFIPIGLAIFSYYSAKNYSGNNYVLEQLHKYLQFTRGESDKKILSEIEEKELFGKIS